MHCKTMCKVFPCIIQLRRYSRAKSKHRFFSKYLYYQGFGYFSNHVIKSQLSNAKLCADQDDA